MIILPFTDRGHTEAAPRHRARADHDGVRVWVGPYATEERAVTKALSMVREAVARGESGDFIVCPDTGAYRKKVFELTEHEREVIRRKQSHQTDVPSLDICHMSSNGECR